MSRGGRRVRRRRRIGRGGLAAGAGALLAVTALGSGLGVPAGATSAAAAQPDETLRLLRIEATDTGASIDVAVPWSASGRTLPVDAFDVSLGDTPVAVTADRLTDRPLLVDLVVDVPADPAAVTGLQGALAEFIDQLEPGARIRLATPAALADFGQDRAAAIDGLRSLGAADPDGYRARLGEVLGDDPPPASAPAGTARVAVISTTGDPVRALADGPTTAALVRGDDYAPAVWSRFGSIATAAPTLESLDAVARDLRSTYRIAVPDAVAGDRVAVQLTTDAGPTRVSGTVPTDASPPPSAALPPDEMRVPAAAAVPSATATVEPVAGDGPTDDGGGWTPILVAVAGMALAVAAAALAASRLSRRRRGHGPDGVVAVDTAGATVPTPQPLPSPPAPAAPPADPIPEVVVTPPPYDPSQMVSVQSAPAEPHPPAPLFSHVPEPARAANGAPLFDRVEVHAPPVAPVFSSSINLRTDVRIAKASAAAESAIARLRAAHDERPDPTPRALAVAIEAAASGWLENRRITADEVVHLLDPERTAADRVSLAYSEGLVDLLEGHDRNLWDLALAFAERLGHPAVPRHAGHYGPPELSSSLVEQVAAVVALGESDFVGRLGGIVGRGLLATWPARTGRLEAMPLIVSPSLAAAAGDLASGSVDPTDLIVGLLAVMEDAALRMMRSEQGVAVLRQRYLDEVNEPLVVGHAKFADKSAPTTPRWVVDHTEALDHVDRDLVELIIGSPVVTTAVVAAELGVDHDRAVAALTGLAERGWLTRLDHEPGPLDFFGERWLAREVLDQATRPFAPDYSPLDPVTVDLTVTSPRSVQHARA